jgi:Holliday junction DNA helicase RuvA
VATGAAAATWRDQVRSGLVSLGWQTRDAEQAIRAVEPELTADTVAQPDVAVALKAALRVLGRQ